MVSLSIRLKALVVTVWFASGIHAVSAQIAEGQISAAQRNSAQIDGFGCVTHAISLRASRLKYAALCDEPRADCDPHDGYWFCSSVTLSKGTPPHIFNTVANANIAAPTTAPVSDTSANLSPEPVGPSDSTNVAETTPHTNHDQTSQDQTNPQNTNPSAATSFPGSVNPAAITDLILVTGQSNALGAGTDFDGTLDAPHQRVYAFTDQGWRVANLNQVWDLNWFPRTSPDTDPSNNFSFHFGKRLASARADRTVGIILVTAPGKAIKHWRYKEEFYRKIESRVLDAINQLPHKSAIDGILWHQGESDGVDSQTYTDALYTLIYHLRTEPWANSGTPFICGETKQLQVNNRLNGLNRDSDPNTACVKGNDLGTLADGHHFNAIGLRTLGTRYADAYIDMLD